MDSRTVADIEGDLLVRRVQALTMKWKIYLELRVLNHDLKSTYKPKHEFHPPVALTWQILDVLMIRVDNLGEFASVHLFLEHPHAHFFGELVSRLGVGAHDATYGRAPVACPRAWTQIRQTECDTWRFGTRININIALWFRTACCSSIQSFTFSRARK